MKKRQKMRKKRKLKTQSIREGESLKERVISSSMKVHSSPKKRLLFENRIENLIDVKTVGAICGVTPKTIHNWVYLKSIPYLKVGRKVMFKKRSLNAWFNQKEIKS